MHAGGSTSPYYMKVEETSLEGAESKLNDILEEALDNEMITNSEFNAMSPANKKAAKFYMTFKVHKEHVQEKALPERPICSACGSIYENIVKFIEHHIKHHATSHGSYIEDTPDFLRKIEKININKELPANAILATLDVIDLFTNIPHKDGIEAFRETLQERVEKQVPTEFIIRLLNIILHNNIMEINGEHYRQERGAPMGSWPVPPFANIFMGCQIDPKLLELANMFSMERESAILFLIFFR